MSEYGSAPNYKRQRSRASHTSHTTDDLTDGDSAGSPESHTATRRTRKISLSRRVTPAPTLSRRLSHVSISRQEVEVGVEGTGENEGGGAFLSMTREKWFIIVTFCMVNFGLGVFYSLLGPFFPNEAASQGSSTTTTGLIFGVFELVLVVMSPIYGNFITQLGAKFLYCTGILVCGSSAVLFGFLDKSPKGTIFIVMCFLVRAMEGLGAAAFSTSSFAIMAHTFPKNVATMFGALELFTGLGLMIGPPVGGVLYEAGGFLLPFAVCGGLMILVGCASIILLPSISDLAPNTGGFVLSLLRIPLVTIMGLYLAIGSAAIGFIDVGLSLWLEDIFHYTPVITGLVFLAMPGVYAITAPIWGVLGDTKPILAKGILILGYVLGSFSFFFMGPAPFIPIANDHIALLVCMQGLAGFGIGTMVLTFLVITDATREYGYPDSLQTYGLISGIFNSFFSIGAFIGPLVGGYLIDQYDFPTASCFFGGGLGVMVVVLAAYVVAHNYCCKSPTQASPGVLQSDDERTPLLHGSSPEHQSQPNGTTAVA